MCEFCENITEMKYANQVSIVKDGNQYHIFDDGGGDSFMAGICVEDIAYCPKCGQKL